jgi:hypothetical protein
MGWMKVRFGCAGTTALCAGNSAVSFKNVGPAPLFAAGGHTGALLAPIRRAAGGGAPQNRR